MQIHEWEIWHTYSTYIQIQSIDLEFAARKLVETGFVELAMLQNGQTFWKSNNEISEGFADINLEPYSSSASIKFEKIPKTANDPGDFAHQAWLQAAHFRFNELRVIGEQSALPHPYLRGFLGRVNFIFSEEDGGKVLCYPILTIYETGIITLEFRTISPEYSTEFQDFLSGAVNLFGHPFEQVEVSPDISKYATRAYYDSIKKWNIFERIELLSLQKKHDNAIDSLAVTYDEGDFQFVLSPLSGAEGSPVKDKLKDVALTIFCTSTYIINNPRFGFKYVLFGQREIPKVASYWTGRPHIHLTKFDKQKKTAKENEKCHGHNWGSILARINIPDKSLALKYLPEDQRPFEDYSVYVSQSALLWVWSQNGLLQQNEHADSNRGHLIYEPQVLSELLEYGSMIHYSLLDRIEGYSQSSEVIMAQSSLLRLENDLYTASHFGEIRELLKTGWKEMGIVSLKEQIANALAIREAETKLNENKITAKIGLCLTAIFGLGTVPLIASEVLGPLWKLLNMPSISDEYAFKTMLNCISLSLVALLLVCVLRWTDRDHNKYKR